MLSVIMRPVISLPAHLVGYTIAGARRRWRLSIRGIESVANARIARRSALLALRRLDCSVERMEATSNRRSLAFVWHTTLSDGTELSVKSIGWTKLAQWADPTKTSELLTRLGPRAYRLR